MASPKLAASATGAASPQVAAPRGAPELVVAGPSGPSAQASVYQSPAAQPPVPEEAEAHDGASEIGAGEDPFGAAFFGTRGGAGLSAASPVRAPEPSVQPVADGGGRASRSGQQSAYGLPPLQQEGIVRTVSGAEGRGWGRGPIPVDPRKFRYDVVRGRALPELSFGSSKSDRLDAAQAGLVLHQIHEMFGIESAEENRVLAFDRALWFEHTVNGASQLQPSRGCIYADGQAFDIQPVVEKLGVDMRRFFRAFADDIAANNARILDSYDPYDFESVEKVGQLRQLAAERGLQKYPHLVHDSADACLAISLEERTALIRSKAGVIPVGVNSVDAMAPRVGERPLAKE